ncbi:hypothetical protein E2C01_007693 [Portunus trituberculatus]|uniref:Uncharacterized protein n=1 Tax=Portunus trituberculatus TaxID=210409 RepID=A0A5B7D0T1_PORTR|nr:hypothetical protein [Portunus trituberculatus]
MCMHPPSRSVGVRHLGQGLVVTRMAREDASSHREPAALLGSTANVPLPPTKFGPPPPSGSHSPIRKSIVSNLSLFENILPVAGIPVQCQRALLAKCTPDTQLSHLH